MLCILWPGCVFSQTQEESERLLQQFEERFVELDSLIFPERDSLPLIPGMRNDHFLNTFLPERAPLVGVAYDSALMNYVNQQIKALKSKTGLSLAGQAYYRPDHAFGLDEDDSESRYNGKIQTELRWNFLKSSLIKRKQRIQEIYLKGEMDHVSNQKDHIGSLIYRSKEYFRSMHDSLLAGVLQHRVHNLVMLSEAHNYLLLNENVSSDELLKILNERAEAERVLVMLVGDWPETHDLAHPEAWSVEIDTVELIQYIRTTQTDLRLMRLRSKMLEQQEQNTNYWQDITLTPFVRYSYYTRPHTSNASNVDIGVSFSFPLSGESGQRKKTIRAERELLEAEGAQVSQQIIDRIRFISGEVNRLNRSLEGEYRRIYELKRYLAERTEAYRNRIGEYSLLARAKEYNIYLSCIEKLIGFQYQRDCYIMDLQGLLADISILWYCRERPLNNTIQN
ncbi:MAG: hypothetical protein K2I90_08365 [Odoribacter sp.]|nr:hypothetical protein [Odoribacter sp.]